MKNGIKYLFAGVMATGIAMSSYGAAITVNWGTALNTFIASTVSPLNYLDGDLVEVGTFAVPPTIGSPSLANFTVFGTTLTGTGANAGIVSGSKTGSDAGFAHNQIYMVAFNNATGVGASLETIFFVNDANNPNWRFPASSDFPNSCSIDLQDMFTGANNGTLAPGATITWGTKTVDPSGPYNVIAMIPEPTTWTLVGTSLLGLLAFRRRS
ncbi:MAG TPA: PEP-CTERM sorting domain-containing protein [Verrucomicrobiae bacterium]|nr:PEP-CTERM sorting domain-containing protein [Verrucomicrobiae bacterium]